MQVVGILAGAGDSESLKAHGVCPAKESTRASTLRPSRLRIDPSAIRKRLNASGHSIMSTVAGLVVVPIAFVMARFASRCLSVASADTGGRAIA
jgi:hypothetical protein